MSIFDKIKKRFRFDVPKEYRAMHKDGLLDMGKLKKCLYLSDTDWFDPEQILDFEKTNDIMSDDFIPFADNASSDVWCWNRKWATKGEPLVAFCPHDDTRGKIFAPDFVSCVYRLMVEEMAHTHLVERVVMHSRELPKLFKRYAGSLSKYLKPEWTKTLKSLSDKPVREVYENEYGFLTDAEVKKILKRDIGYKRQGEEVKLFDP